MEVEPVTDTDIDTVDVAVMVRVNVGVGEREFHEAEGEEEACVEADMNDLETRPVVLTEAQGDVDGDLEPLMLPEDDAVPLRLRPVVREML